jgi:hypothetical protein
MHALLTSSEVPCGSGSVTTLRAGLGTMVVKEAHVGGKCDREREEG